MKLFSALITEVEHLYHKVKHSLSCDINNVVKASTSRYCCLNRHSLLPQSHCSFFLFPFHLQVTTDLHLLAQLDTEQTAVECDESDTMALRHFSGDPLDQWSNSLYQQLLFAQAITQKRHWKNLELRKTIWWFMISILLSEWKNSILKMTTKENWGGYLTVALDESEYVPPGHAAHELDPELDE